MWETVRGLEDLNIDEVMYKELYNRFVPDYMG